jgi:hypothetical protein
VEKRGRRGKQGGCGGKESGGGECGGKERPARAREEALALRFGERQGVLGGAFVDEAERRGKEHKKQRRDAGKARCGFGGASRPNKSERIKKGAHPEPERPVRPVLARQGRAHGGAAPGRGGRMRFAHRLPAATVSTKSGLTMPIMMRTKVSFFSLIGCALCSSSLIDFQPTQAAAMAMPKLESGMPTLLVT